MKTFSITATGHKRVTLIRGDGIGPEVTGAAVRVIEAAGVTLAWEERLAGAQVFKAGNPTGVPDDTIESLRQTRIALKGPLETPVGFGEKSANVTLRKLFETYEQGAKTSDVQPTGAMGTRAFTDAVIANLGKRPSVRPARAVKPLVLPTVATARDFVKVKTRRLAGVDVFLESALEPENIGRALEELCLGTPLRLKMISNRGTQVYPLTGTLTDCVDHWRCRFITRADTYQLRNEELWDLLSRIQKHFAWMHLEKLQEFDGALGWTRAQGEGETPGA
jgi:hypothetical protein